MLLVSCSLVRCRCGCEAVLGLRHHFVPVPTPHSVAAVAACQLSVPGWSPFRSGVPQSFLAFFKNVYIQETNHVPNVFYV